MPHCQKEFAKPPVSSKQKKAQQQAKKEADKAKASKRSKEEDAELERQEAEKTPEQREAELARDSEATRKVAEAKKLKDAKVRGDKAFKANDMVEALSSYSECIELDPEDHVHWSNRSLVNKILANFDEALADAIKCTVLDPEFVKGWHRLGAAYLTLDNFDAAEEAFQRGLTLNADHTACQDGLKEVVKARETSTQEREFDRLLKELQTLEPAQLKEKALEAGVREDKVQQAESSRDPKEAFTSLITAHKYLVDLIEEELQGLDLVQLRERAAQEGVEEDDVAKAASADDPREALLALMVSHLSNDLVEAATDLQAEAAETYEDSSDEGEQHETVDIEIVMDDTDLQLGVNDVFLAGAYIDPTYGELVLPSGVRLGNRALSKYYKQKARPTNDRAVAIRGGSKSMMNKLSARLMRDQERRMMMRGLACKGDVKAISTQLARSNYKQKEADNKAMRAIVHHWGGGGGGSHYHMAGSKQYNKGNKVKGVILRHSVQGAKLQAARNKSNRGTKSVACLQ